jgi:hypothetical protein
VSLESLKWLLQMMHVIPWNQIKGDDVINVTFGKVNAYKQSIHQVLEFYRGIIQTKW